MNKAELVAKLTKAHAEKLSLSRKQIMDAIRDASSDIEKQFVAAVNSKNAKQVGEIILQLAEDAKLAESRNIVKTMLAGDSVNITDLLQLL